MKLITIRQYAKSQNISYEAVRKQVVRYAAELDGHIVTQGRTQYLDEEAVKFLTEKRRESPVVVVTMDQGEEIRKLTEQVELLKAQLVTAQNELLKEKDRVIGLQDELRLSIEDRSRARAALEDHAALEARAKAAEEREQAAAAREQEASARAAEAESRAADATIQLDQAEETIRADEVQRAADREHIEDLQRRLEEAQAEAGSFKKSIFGFYRKK